MNLGQLQTALTRGAAPTIEIHAVEHMYIAFAREGETLRPLVNQQDKTLTYKSRHQALSAMAKVGLESVEFVHRSAYVEMVGSHEETNTEMRQTIVLRNFEDA